MYSVQRILVLGTASLFALSLEIAGRTQDAPAPQSGSSSAQSETAPNGSSSKKKSKHTDDFLIRGTVFTPEGLSLPAAEVRIRRSNEKRIRWRAVTNSRGQFAVRVKQGADYEVAVRERGFKDQSKTVDAKSGGNLEELTIRMEREGGAKQ